MVFDESTGAVKALLNAGNLTAVRTAAGSGLATRILLGKDAKSLRIVAFGAGAQIKAHVGLLLALYPSLQKCTIVNRALNDRSTDLVNHLTKLHSNATFSAVAQTTRDEVESAVRDADIVVAATSSTVALFENEWIKPGAHVILVGSYKPTMREAPDELIRRAKFVLVDSREACAAEAGELISSGIAPEQMVEVGELVDNPSRVAEIRSASDVTIFKSVGVAAQDVAIACAVVERAEQLGIGTTVQFDA
ncbi:NAD(P)-binding protein [Exidia glandulosa HHB12029]|uniref:NAD(P)-binding protein n=1 Tax=Exidia glandulosa HHB12029 TaxID=1314781 RepID=A0A165HWE7_EXIGL|nr:NAD(P)-binding protein [Exidia glandulosa HHB12029]